MEELPKLIPLWQNVTLKDAYNAGRYTYNPSIFPDYGGAGVDMTVRSNVECTSLKSSVAKVSFASKCCALPFLPPNKVKSLHDPCMAQLLKLQKEKIIFESKLKFLWGQAKKDNTSFKNSLICFQEYMNSNSSKDSVHSEISVPEQVLDLVKKMPEGFVPRGNWSYSGGCLGTLMDETLNAKIMLFHPLGGKMDKLAVVPVTENKAVIAATDQRKVIKLTGGRILQIEAESALESHLCCVRQEKVYHYINLDGRTEDLDFPYPVESFSMEQDISSICMSPYVPGEHAVVTKNGLLLLQDVEIKNVVWEINEPLEHDPAVQDSWWGCDFGAHPRSLMFMDRMKLSEFDLRMKKPVDIVSLPNPFFLQNECLMVMKRYPGNEFQHIVATDFHMFIFDERYPQQPVMSWKHMLECFPLYCDVKCYSPGLDASQYVILLGSQETQEIASFYLQSTSQLQPMSLSSPLHLSTFSDCARCLKLHGIPLDETISRRLSFPTIGICAIPHSKQTGFTTLQMSSIGDIFSQHFQLLDDDEEKTYHVGPGCVLTPPNEILPEMNQWLDMARVEEKQVVKSMCYVDSSKVLSEILRRNKIARKCSLCQDLLLSNDTDKVDAEVCPSCGIHVDLSNELVEKMQNSGILAGSLHTQTVTDLGMHPPVLNLVDFEKSTTGPISKKILEIWTNDDILMSSERNKSTVPFLQSYEEYSESLQRFVVNAHSSEKQKDNIDSQIISSKTPDHVNSSTSAHAPIIEENLDTNHMQLDDDLIAPSQEIRPLIGETLRTPHKPKKQKLYSSAGF